MTTKYPTIHISPSHVKVLLYVSENAGTIPTARDTKVAMRALLKNGYVYQRPGISTGTVAYSLTDVGRHAAAICRYAMENPTD